MKVDSMIDQIPTAKPKLASDLSDLRGKTDEELKKAAKDFESMFMNIVMKEMRKTVPDSGMFGEGGGNKIRFFETMLDEEYTKMMEDSPNSLSNIIYNNLNRILGRGSQADLQMPKGDEQ